MKKIMFILILGLVGCERTTSWCEQDEPELVTVSEELSLALEAGAEPLGSFGTAECPPDHHVVRGWCSLSWEGVRVEEIGAFGTDQIPVKGRFSTHAAQADGWTCAGTLAEPGSALLEVWVECRSGGGMER